MHIHSMSLVGKNQLGNAEGFADHIAVDQDVIVMIVISIACIQSRTGTFARASMAEKNAVADMGIRF
jgi:hypothetical protein